VHVEAACSIDIFCTSECHLTFDHWLLECPTTHEEDSQFSEQLIRRISNRSSAGYPVHAMHRRRHIATTGWGSCRPQIYYLPFRKISLPPNAAAAPAMTRHVRDTQLPQRLPIKARRRIKDHCALDKLTWADRQRYFVPRTDRWGMSYQKNSDADTACSVLFTVIDSVVKRAGDTRSSPAVGHRAWLPGVDQQRSAIRSVPHCYI